MKRERTLLLLASLASDALDGVSGVSKVCHRHCVQYDVKLNVRTAKAWLPLAVCFGLVCAQGY